VVHARCAGLDVHKKSVYGCVICCEASGEKRREKRSFGTMTADLLSLADWLREHAITHVVMEATGVYWRPVWAILEGQFELLLVNPHHVKAIPGRKTDAKDCEWIAELLQHGLLRGSFVPPTEIQDLRDLTRYRVELTQAQNRVANRIQKLLEQANIKLSSVASDALGVSGQQMIEAIISGEENPAQLAQLARGKLKSKIPQLERALEGRCGIPIGFSCKSS
jgi:transposase